MLLRQSPARAPEPASPQPSVEDGRTPWRGCGRRRPCSRRILRSDQQGRHIVGKIGDPVFASASGRVVYSGLGLRGYGSSSSSSTTRPICPPMPTTATCW